MRTRSRFGLASLFLVSSACGSLESELISPVPSASPEPPSFDYCKQEAYGVEVDSSSVDFYSEESIRSYCSRYFQAWLERFESCLNDHLSDLGYSYPLYCQAISGYMHERFLDSCVRSQIEYPRLAIAVSSWECYEEE